MFPLEPVGDTHRKALPEGFLLALREGSQGGVTLPITVLPPPPSSPSPSGAPESAHPLDDITATFHAVQSRNAYLCHSLSPDVIFPEERCVAAHGPCHQTDRLRPLSADRAALRNTLLVWVSAVAPTFPLPCPPRALAPGQLFGGHQAPRPIWASGSLPSQMTCCGFIVHMDTDTPRSVPE